MRDTRFVSAALTTQRDSPGILRVVEEASLLQQRTVPGERGFAVRPAGELDQRRVELVDRVAASGIVVTLLVATAWVALDPVQIVSHPAPVAAAAPGAGAPEPVARAEAPLPAAPVAAAPAPAAAVTDRSPVRRLALPSQTWQVVTDGRYVAYPRVDVDGANVVVVGDLEGGRWRVAYRTGERRVLGQLSLANGVLVFEELDSGTSAPSVTIHALRLDGERWTLVPGEHGTAVRPAGELDSLRVALVDEYLVPGANRDAVAVASAAPTTDGRRVFWVRQTGYASGLRVSEIRALDLASGASRALYRTAAAVPVLAVWKETLAFTVLSEGAPAIAMTLDLASGDARPVDGFSYAYVQDIGPRGLALLASDSPEASVAAWLVDLADGGRVRLGVDCSVAMSERVLATRCGPQLEVRDLVTGRALQQHSFQLGLPAVFDRGAVWSDGEALVVYELPALPSDDFLSP